MILRRFSQALKEQNWTAIVIEFVLLVVGVFLGIQVANWNAERENRSRESIYLATLAEDLQSDVAEMERIQRVSTKRMSALNYLLRNATGQELPTGFESARGKIEIEDAPPFDENDPNTIGINLFILSNLDGNRLTYDTMINTGGIGVFRDPSLVRDIRSYYANVDAVLSFEKALMDSRWRLVDAQQQAGLSPVDLMPATEITKAFADDKRLIAAAKKLLDLHQSPHERDNRIATTCRCPDEKTGKRETTMNLRRIIAFVGGPSRPECFIGFSVEPRRPSYHGIFS